jgi:hypothetical protein
VVKKALLQVFTQGQVQVVAQRLWVATGTPQLGLAARVAQVLRQHLLTQI